MPRMGLVPIILIAAVVSISFNLRVQSAADDEALWLTAVDKYQKGHYASAAIDFRGIIDLGYSSYESSAQLMLGRCYLKQRQLEKAKASARKLISKFPHSRYLPHAYYLSAEALYLQKDYFEAAWYLLMAAQITTDDNLNLLAREKLCGVFESFLNDTQRESLLRSAESPEIIAELEDVHMGFKAPVRVGVVIDLSGASAAEGKALLRGIEAACRNVDDRLPQHIELLTRDSQGDAIQATKSTRELIYQDEVVALIGGFSGSCNAAIAAVAAAKGVPLIIPTATDYRFDDIGGDVYQLVANYHMEGKIVADYVINTLGIERVSILAPVTERGRQTVDGFMSLNGFSGVIQWYYPDATNYRRQLDNLVRAGADSLGEELQLSDEDVQALVAWEENSKESEVESIEGWLTPEISVVDSLLDIYTSPINFFQVLFIPIKGEEILLLAPQIAATGFSGYLIGNSNCLNYVEDESNLRYVDGIIFPSHFSISRAPKIDRKLMDKLELPYGQQVNNFNLLGWDAFNFLAVAFEGEGRLSASKVADILSRIDSFKGECLKMEFSPGSRVNNCMYILKFENGRFHQLKSP